MRESNIFCTLAASAYHIVSKKVENYRDINGLNTNGNAREKSQS